MKQRHELFKAKTASEFLQLVKTADASIDEILSVVLPPAIQHGLVLCGSLAEGLGTAESDIDLLVLVDNFDALLVDRNQNWTYNRGAELDRSSAKVYRHGMEFNVEVVALDRLDALSEAVQQLIQFSRTGNAANQLPLLEDTDLKLLHQLRAGWGLKNEEMVDGWRKKFGTALLPIYMTINNFVLYREYLEDVVSVRYSEVPGGALFVGRVASTCACKAILALAGETNPNVKWTAHLIHKIATSSSPFALLASKALPLLFPPFSSDKEVIDEYVQQLVSVGHAIYTILKDDPRISSLLPTFDENVHYIGV